MKNSLLFLVLLLTSFSLSAQIPVPAKAQSQTIAIRNVTLHDGNGQMLTNAAVVFADGKITFVGKDADLDTKDAQVIDGTGKHLYPGLILTNTILGLEEIGAVAATQDQAETGSFNPEVRSIVAYNTDSQLIPTTRTNGILLAQVVPEGGLVSGTSAVVQLDAWNWEDAAVRPEEGIHFRFPQKVLPPRWWMNETEARPNPQYKAQLQAFTDALQAGKAYVNAPTTPANLKLAAMKGLYDGTRTAYLHVDYAEGIVAGVQLLQKEGAQKIVLIGGAEAFYVKDFLVANKIPIILRNVHSLPYRDDEPVDQPYSLPKLLTEAGLTVALGYEGVSNARNLPFFAGTTVTHGLDKETALQLITKNPAIILGIAERFGTIDVGKSATLLLTSGDLLDMRESQVEQAFIDGRALDLDNKHHQLYRRFQQKYTKPTE
ncbi:MAG: amidohydrolase family protein [Bernardetiaceae bacterium]